MPTISMFYGIMVMMYALDTHKHHLQHIHLQYTEFSAVVQIPNGELPAKQMKLVQAWIALHVDDLMADWTPAAAGSTPYKIDSLG